SNNVTAKMAVIMGNGRPGDDTTLNVNSAFQPSVFKDQFIGKAGGRWDNPTFTIKFGINDASYNYHMTANGGVCQTQVAVVTSTRVVDPDNDGKLSIWETSGLHLNTGSAYPGHPSFKPATFGTCADYPSEPCVPLHLMGNDPQKKDINIEIDFTH